MISTVTKIAFQGIPGAYSQIACHQYAPQSQAIPCNTFYNAFSLLRKKDVTLAIIPIRNSIAGRVPDIHMLLPNEDIFIVDEYFLKIDLCLLAPKGTTIEDIDSVYSHPVALRQCQKFLIQNKLTSVEYTDTAAAARMIHTNVEKNHRMASVSSALCASLYDLDIIASHVQDYDTNITRFIVLSNQKNIPPRLDNKRYISAFFFHVNNTPASLYKALGGFATNGVNILSLESYQMENFRTAQFYAEVDAHSDDDGFKQAIAELKFYTDKIKIIGVFEQDTSIRGQ